MTSMTVAEAEANFGSMLSRSQAERLVIERDGKPVAVVVGIEDCDLDQFDSVVRPDLVEASKQRQRLPSRTDAFVELADRLTVCGQVDAALDLIFERVDEMFVNGRFEECDRVLQSVPVSEYTADTLIGLLTATLPAKSRLKSRPDFFAKVESVLKGRGEMEPGLLTGLES